MSHSDHEPIEDGQADDEQVSESHEATDLDSDKSETDSILSKKTLKLGEQATSSSESDAGASQPQPETPPNSQVSSGWLGKAYNAEARRIRAEKEKEDKNDKKNFCSVLAKELSCQTVHSPQSKTCIIDNIKASQNL